MKITRKRWIRKVRILSQLLFLSVAVNVGLISTFAAISFKERNSLVFLRPFKRKNANSESETLSSLLSLYRSCSFRELLSLMTNKEHVEDGFLKRDLALGCLVQFHHFYLHKSLSAFSFEEREIEGITLYLSLNDYHFESILRFAYTEKWPLTPQGLFLLLKKWPSPKDASLMQAFYLSDPFLALHTLFPNSENSILLGMILHGEWEDLNRFYEKRELTDTARKDLLLLYLLKASSIAAELMLKHDLLFAVKKLDNEQILLLLSLLEKKTDDAEFFCLELLKSSRSDQIHRACASLLCKWSDQKLSEPYNHQETLARFLPQLKEKVDELRPLSSVIWDNKPHVHIVNDGENLWKIARKYHIELDELIRVNQLKDDRIHSGDEIIIP